MVERPLVSGKPKTVGKRNDVPKSGQAGAVPVAVLGQEGERKKKE